MYALTCGRWLQLLIGLPMGVGEPDARFAKGAGTPVQEKYL